MEKVSHAVNPIEIIAAQYETEMSEVANKLIETNFGIKRTIVETIATDTNLIINDAFKYLFAP